MNPDVVAACRAAFSKAIRDPAYLAEAAKRTQSITARDGAFVQKTIDDMYATPASIIDLVRQATNPTGRIDKQAK